MALRALGRQLSQLAPHWSRCSSSTPTVFDKLVQFYVIDRSGDRHALRGLEGQTLAEALKDSGEFSEQYFMPHPYDTAMVDCHVYVGGDYIEKLPKLDLEDELTQKSLVEDRARQKARENSRMGYYIKLAPELNGMTVAIGEIEPWEIQ